MMGICNEMKAQCLPAAGAASSHEAGSGFVATFSLMATKFFFRVSCPAGNVFRNATLLSGDV